MEGSTGSEIRFTCQPAGTIGEDQSRCGIILVRYHNLSCYHHIFVRQGYAPIRVAGSAKWHTFNLKYQDHEAAAPCEEGSLFRYGNVDQPIDAVNNQFDRECGPRADPDNEQVAQFGGLQQHAANHRRQAVPCR